MQDVFVAPNAAVGESIGARPLATLAVRRTEFVLLSFYLYATVAACILPVGRSVESRVILLNLFLGLAYFALIWRDSVRRGQTLAVVRDWLPLALVLLAYREMGWFALPHVDHALESGWVAWDRIALRGGGKALVEVLGPLIPSALELAYALVYALAPASIAILYLSGRRAFADRFLFIFVAAVLLCYAQFPFWPSEPPRAVFFGEDFPAYDTILRRFNLWMLGNYGIHTSVFPSAHVAGAFASAFGMKAAAPANRLAYRCLLVIAILIATATVYGRYHYLADASAGLVVATGTAAAAGRLAGLRHS